MSDNTPSLLILDPTVISLAWQTLKTTFSNQLISLELQLEQTKMGNESQGWEACSAECHHSELHASPLDAVKELLERKANQDKILDFVKSNIDKAVTSVKITPEPL